MRIISYEEYEYHFESWFLNLKDCLKGNNSYNLIDFVTQYPDGIEEEIVAALELAFTHNLLTKNDIDNTFNYIKIDSKFKYWRIIRILCIYEYLYKSSFPLKLEIDITNLRRILSETPSEFIIKNINYEGQFNYINQPDYYEIISKYKGRDLYVKYKELIINNPDKFITSFYRNSGKYSSCFNFVGIDIDEIINYLQIFIDEGLINNNQINYILSKISIINVEDWFILIDKYVEKMIYLNKFKWHNYTINIDIKMLLNKMADFISSYSGKGLNTQAVVNLYKRLNYPLDIHSTPQQRHELDMFYREKYRKLYEAELKEKENK